jgi:outer membrane beta-barrel protein/carboxypeptidase-like protein
MSKSFLLLLLLSFSLASYSQNTITIKGKILDKKTQVPLEAATVYLTAVSDSTVIDYTITDKNGAFLMTTKKITKPFFLKVSYMGYRTLKEEQKSITENKDFGVLRLAKNENALGEVIVKNEAPPIRIKKDTLEFNASSFKVRPDANVETLLKQLPGVEIDADGKITVNGKEVNQVLVNGKPFFDKDGKIALQSLPSDIINKVQVTDTKTKKEEVTKQAASSNNASINLTIDEEKNKGLFGRFMVGYGTDDRYESSALVNYFKNKRKISVLASSNNINSIGFSMDEVFDNMGGGRNVSYYFNPEDGSYGFGSLRFGGGKGIIRSNMLGVNYADEWLKGFETNGSYFFSSSNARNVNRTRQVNLLPTGNFTTLSNATTRNESSGHNATLNFEYKIDSTSSLVVTPKFVTSHTQNSGKSYQSSLDNANQLLNENTSEDSEARDGFSFSNTINYNKAFRRKGRYLNVMVENINTNADVDALNKSVTQFYQSGDPDDIRDQIRTNRNIKDSYATEIEFAEPIMDSLNLKLAIYGRWEKSSDDKRTFDFNPVSQTYTEFNAPLSSNISSTMQLVTPKSGFSIQRKKVNFDLSAGTTITGMENFALYLGNKSVLNKTYIFPYITAYGSYRFSKSKGLWTNYEYQAGFPTALQLLPIENLADPLNTYIGNPNLDMTDGHSINISYNNYDYASRSGYTVYYATEFYNSQIVNSSVFDSNGKRATTYANVSGTFTHWLGSHWNKSWKKEANTFKVMLGVNSEIRKSKGFTDNNLYMANSLQLTPRVNLTYEYGELLTINPTYSFTYNQTDYNNYIVSSASNVLHKFNLQTTNYWPKNWIFGNDFGYTYNSNIADGFKKDFYLWNSSLAYNFFNKKMTVKVKVYDILNQNQSATRTITPTTIRDEENIVLKRYMMFSLTYKIEKFAGKEKPARNRFMMH